MQFHCPACSASFSWKADYAGRAIRCRCGEMFVPPDPDETDRLAPTEEYDVADDPPPARRVPSRPRVPASSAAPVTAARAVVPDSVLAHAAALYPHRTAKPVEEKPDPAEDTSPIKNVYVPLVLLALGLILRVTQLLFANEGYGNRWAGNLAAPGGVGKAALLVIFEMIIATCIMGLGAFVSTMLLDVDFGSLARAALKLCATAVFTTGIVSWIAVFDQGRFSVSGLVIGLHVMVILSWIALAYFFSLDLQEVLLTVAVITLLYSMAVLTLWRA